MYRQHCVRDRPVLPRPVQRRGLRGGGDAAHAQSMTNEQAETLGEPYTRHLGGKVHELRFHLLARQTRITYWLAPGRRVILLTVFRKTRSADSAEVTRALQAQKICEAGHGPPPRHIRPGGALR